MLIRLITIVVTLLSTSLSCLAFANDCQTSAEEDAVWLNSQPTEPVRTAEEQSYFSEKIVAYFKATNCQKNDSSVVIDELVSGSSQATDGMICATDSGIERVTLRLSDGQIVALNCQRQK